MGHTRWIYERVGDMRLFIHIPKNGGMSIRKCEELKGQIMLAGRGNHISEAYSESLLKVMTAAYEHHGYEHARWRDWRADLREKYTAFAIVRNPWSRIVSRWTFAKLVHSQGKQLLTTGFTFQDFLNERHIYGGRDFYWHRAIRGWYPQVDHVLDQYGVQQCDVLRQEHLNEDAAAYLGLTKPLDRRNVSSGILGMPADYREYYGSDEIDIVAEWYRRDIEHFGFTFDGAATRNIWCDG